MRRMNRLSRAVCFVAALLGAAACGAARVAPVKLVGVWHTVTAGETADAVAARYGADAATVIELNDLPANGALDGRREIFVPKQGGAVPGTGEKPVREEIAVRSPAPGSSSDGVAAPASPPCGSDGRPCLAWPAQGRLVARFGSGSGADHDGIDIAAPKGTPVVAAEKGRVVYSGAGIQGYGNLVLIRHESGLITVYAHNDANEVKEGDEVARGQKIASIGQSGSATAPHLHFEVREGESPRDPLAYLQEEEGP
jgi:murein DD-endopeptidase MepM/ murein hydrolase activator NlpD